MAKIDEKELERGTKEEMEHTKDPKIARKIATDHLLEDALYYKKLRDCGLMSVPAANLRAAKAMVLLAKKILSSD